MSRSRNDLDASYALCRQMCRRAGSSFCAAFWLLPRKKRRAMEAIYAFMRHTDDLADSLMENPAKRRHRRPSFGAIRRIDQLTLPDSLSSWRAMVNRALLGDAISPPSLLPALVDTVHEYQIPHEHLLAAIDGCEMDLAPTQYETFEQLEHYCEHVASAVGIACIYIWGFRGPEAFEPARRLGIAYQMTNILRDIKEDAANGRIYLPTADLRECSYSAKNLTAGVVNREFVRLMEYEIARTEQFYRDGSELYNCLLPDGRRILGLMTSTYWTLLQKIALRPEAVLRGRVRIRCLKRLRLFARWAFWPPRREALP
jgi:15-cis-phytoene synthase